MTSPDHGRDPGRDLGRLARRWVDPAPVREHVRGLVGTGMAFAEVGRRSGVPVPTVWVLVNGVSGRPIRRMRRDTALALLSVEAPAVTCQEWAAPHGWVRAVGTRRRVEALIATGWTFRAIADAAGVSRATLTAVLSGQSLVEAATRNAIAAAYGRLIHSTPRAGCGATRSRNLAAAKGWTAVAVWTGAGIDDPAATPAEDRRVRRLDQLVDLLYVEPGLTVAQAAQRLGITRGAVLGAVRHAGRRDLAEQLVQNRARHSFREAS